MKEIINRYKSGEITLDEANGQLKEYGIYLLPLTEEERHAKKVREDLTGFFPAAPKHAAYPDTPDMSRNSALAGQTVIQKTASGPFEVAYDENGYAVKATRAGWMPPDSGEEG